MLEKENPLPCAELHPSVGEWDAQLRLGQRALDVGRHVVRPLVVVAVEGDVFRYDPLQKIVEIAQSVITASEIFK